MPTRALARGRKSCGRPKVAGLLLLLLVLHSVHADDDAITVAGQLGQAPADGRGGGGDGGRDGADAAPPAGGAQPAAAPPLSAADLRARFLPADADGASNGTARAARPPRRFVIQLRHTGPSPAEAAAAAPPGAKPADAIKRARAAGAAQAAGAAEAAGKLLADAEARGIAVARSKVYGWAAAAMLITLKDSADREALEKLLEGHPSVAGFQRPTARGTNVAGPWPAASAATQEVAPRLIGIDEFNGGDDWTQLAAARAALPKVTGSKVTIGFVDSGLDATHPALGGCSPSEIGTPSCRVRISRDFVSGPGAQARSLRPSDAAPAPRACDARHGNMAAGVAAGDASGKAGGSVPWIGVAPKAWLADLRAMADCLDDYYAYYYDDYEHPSILAAVDAAVDAGVDIIALSFSFGPGPGTSRPLANALANAAAQGVIVAAAAGDGGKGGLFSMQSELPGEGTPAAASPNVIAVASIDNILVPSADLTFSRAVNQGSDVITARAVANVRAPAPKLPARVVAPSVDYYACEIVPTDDVRGTIIVLPGVKEVTAQNRDCWSEQTGARLAWNAADQGAAALVILDTSDLANAHEIYTGGSGTSISDLKIQVFMLDGATTGDALLATIADGNPLKLTDIGPRRATPVPNGKGPSVTSSWGPGIHLEMKPDIAAPGGAMWTAVGASGYATVSGTLASSSFIAGVLALMRQYKGAVSFDDARAALMTTALPVERFTPLLGPRTEPVAHVGAGLVQVHAALVNAVKITPYQVNLPSTVPSGYPYTHTRTFSVTNTGRRSVSYRLSHRPAATIAPLATWFAPETGQQSGGLDYVDFKFDTSGNGVIVATVNFSKPGYISVPIPDGVITVPPKRTVSFMATFDARQLYAGGGYSVYSRLILSGYVQLTPLPSVDSPAKGKAPATSSPPPPPLSVSYQMSTSAWRDISPFPPYRYYSPLANALFARGHNDGGRFLTCELQIPTCYGCPCETSSTGYYIYLNASQPAVVRAWVAWWHPLESATLVAYGYGPSSSSTLYGPELLAAAGEIPYIVKAGTLWSFEVGTPAHPPSSDTVTLAPPDAGAASVSYNFGMRVRTTLEPSDSYSYDSTYSFYNTLVIRAG